MRAFGAERMRIGTCGRRVAEARRAMSFGHRGEAVDRVACAGCAPPGSRRVNG